LVVRRVRILDDAVDETKIATGAVKVAEVASDSVGADELIETDAFNFSNTSSTFGRLLGVQQIAEVKVTDASAGANNFTFPITFAGVPTVAVTKETTSTASYVATVSGLTTTGGTLNVDSAGTYHIVAIYHP